MDAVARVYTVDERDSMLGVLPFFHAFGYTYALWFPLLSGFRCALHPNPTDSKTIGELAAEYRLTFLLTTPTFCLGYLRKCTREQFATLRYVLAGAEARPGPGRCFRGEVRRAAARGLWLHGDGTGDFG